MFYLLVDDNKTNVIGASCVQRELHLLLTDKGRFKGDHTPPNTCYAAMLRSPYAHAKTLSLNIQKEIIGPGILAILTG